MIALEINFDAVREKQLLNEAMKPLRGLHRIEIRKWRARRTDPQNRFYWGVIIQSFFEYDREQDEHASTMRCHRRLKSMFLKSFEPDMRTGEMIEHVGSTADLSIDEFSEYLEKCMKFLAEMCGVVIQDSPMRLGKNE